MNLEQAVQVLNEKRHEGFTGWHIQEESRVFNSVEMYRGTWSSLPWQRHLSEFEAIAVAEHYERGNLNVFNDIYKCRKCGCVIPYSAHPHQTLTFLCNCEVGK